MQDAALVNSTTATETRLLASPQLPATDAITSNVSRRILYSRQLSVRTAPLRIPQTIGEEQRAAEGESASDDAPAESPASSDDARSASHTSATASSSSDDGGGGADGAAAPRGRGAVSATVRHVATPAVGRRGVVSAGPAFVAPAGAAGIVQSSVPSALLPAPPPQLPGGAAEL